jgi:hypothetical protein
MFTQPELIIGEVRHVVDKVRGEDRRHGASRWESRSGS